MPPRGRPSSRAGRGVGRGSQRGARGGARGGANESQPDTPSQAEEADPVVDDGSSIAAAPAARPAATTAAAAPSPSLRGRGLSSSYAKPSPFLAAGARAAAAPRPTSSFKPKANKRSEAERIEMEQQELRKLNERAAEEAELRRAMFSGGRRGRGRGYASGVGRGGLVKRVVTPSGPFSQPPGAFGSPSTASRGGGLGSGGGGGSYRGRGSRAKTEAWSGTTQSLDDSPERFRINTDLFSSQMTLDDDSSMPRAHLLPMGILREEHRDAEVLVATSKAGVEAKEDPDATPEQESDSDGMWVEDSEHPGIVDDNKVWPGAPKASRIKIEGEEMTTIDGLAAKRQGKTIPREQQTTATTSAQEAAAGEAGEAGPPAAGGAGTRRPGSRRAKKPKKTKKTKAQEAEKQKNPEVEDEELRRQILLNEFGLLNLDAAAGAANPQDKEGRLYMLNFPPVLAPLQAVQPDAGVKQEPEDDDVVMTDGAPKARIDLTNDANDAEIKEEDGTAAKAPGGAQRPGHQMDASGFLGMLHVRKSGRAELDWGGLKLEMMAKTLPNMLQSVVLLEQSDTKRKAGDTTSAGKAYGMGPIMAKFGFNIDLGEEKEWIVDPADLEE